MLLFKNRNSRCPQRECRERVYSIEQVGRRVSVPMREDVVPQPLQEPPGLLLVSLAQVFVLVVDETRSVPAYLRRLQYFVIKPFCIDLEKVVSRHRVACKERWESAASDS